MQMHTGDFGDAPSSMKFFALLVAVTNVYLVNCRLVDSQIESGFDSRSMSMRTGHKSSAVESYIRESQKFQMDISHTLEPVAISATESETESATEQVDV